MTDTPRPAGDDHSLTDLGHTSPRATEHPDTEFTSTRSSAEPEEPGATRPSPEAESIARNPSQATGWLPPVASGRSPRFLGEYELLEELARGGMGVVYLARQDKLNRLVALKLIRSGSLAGAEDLRRFRQETEAIAELDHPHIIPIYEIGQQDDQPYFSMKLIEGGNLTQHIARLKDDPAAVAALMAKVARAVHYAHQHTILHRDIKPSNILLDEHDEPYVTDFGLAKRIGPDSGTAATVTGAVMGTPAYMPPEQARGGTKTVTTAADIYGLGATLYEALTGQPPFAGDSVGEIMRQVLDQEPARPRSINPKLDHDLETICLKCLAKEPVRRYGSAEALAEDLERWRAGVPITARPVPAWERVVKWVKRQPQVAALILVLFLALAGLFGGGVWFTLQLGSALDMAYRGRYAADMTVTRHALVDRLIYQARKQLKTYGTGPRELASLRGFEWYYLWNLCDQTPIPLLGHEKAVICLAFPDGNRVVSGGSDGTVRVWDLDSRQALKVFEGTGQPIFCVAVSPDGRWLAAGDGGGGLRLWGLETGQERGLAGHKSGLRSLAFSPRRDSLHLLSCDVGGLIVQWDVGTGKRDFDLHHRHEGDIVPGSTNAPEIHTFGTVAAYGPDGRTIVSVGMNQWVMIWDATTHQVLEQVPTAGIPDGSLSITSNGRQLAFGMSSAAVEILDLGRLHEQSRVFPTGSGMPKVALSPDGNTLAICRATGEVQLLDPQSGQVQDMFDAHVNTSNQPMAFGPDGRRLAMAVGAEVRVVRVFRSLHGTSVASIPGPIRRLAASPDQELLALGRDDGTIAIWDLRKSQVVQTLRGHELGVQALAFVNRPDGAWLVSAGGDGRVQIWDPRAGGQPLRTLSGHRGVVFAVAVRADGRQIATGGGTATCARGTRSPDDPTSP